MIQGYPASTPEAIRRRLIDAGVEVEPYEVDVPAFRAYLRDAPYPRAYVDSYGPVFVEKALEHYVSLELLGRSRFLEGIDIASCHSPFPEVVRSLTHVPIYRQDLDYPSEIGRFVVGGSAGRLPFPGRFFKAMTLHCSLEHFEGTADTEFVREAARLLQPGGRVCVLPLYLSDAFANITDPALQGDAVFDTGAALHAVEGWNNRFGRFYDVNSLLKRILWPASSTLRPTIYDVVNAPAVDPGCYLRFALVMERRAGPADARVR